MCVKANMTKYSPSGEVKDKSSPIFRSVTQVLLKGTPIQDQLDSAYFKISDSLEKFKRDGSGWRLDDIQFMEQTIIKYNPIRGSCSSFEMPSLLKRKRCLLSVVWFPSDSLECFKYSVLAGLNVPSTVIGEINWTDLRQYSNALTFENINQRTNGPVNAHLRSASYTNKHI